MQFDVFQYPEDQQAAVAELNALNASVGAMFGDSNAAPSEDDLALMVQIAALNASADAPIFTLPDADAGFVYSDYEAQAIADLTALQNSINFMFAPTPGDTILQ